MKKLLKYALPLTILLGFMMRLVALGQSLWLDESIGAIAAKTFSFTDILLKFPLKDNHPPLYYLILKAWASVFGYSEVSLRLPSVIFGVLTIFFVYKIAKKFTKVNPVVPAILLATSPLAIYYSQEARMYTLAGFIATAAVYFYLRTFEKDSSLRTWTGFGIFYTLLIFSDYMPAFLYPIFIIYPFIIKAGWPWWKRFLLANIPIATLGILWLPIFLKQGTAGKWLLATLPAWKSVAGGATFKQLGVFWSKFVLGRISLFNKYIYYGLVFLASVPILIALLKSLKKVKDSSFIWLWMAVPVVLGFLASFLFPAFIYFRYIFVLPAFYLLISAGASYFRKAGKFIIAAVIIFNLVGWGIYVFNPTEHREDWRGAVSYIEENAGPDEVAIFENTEPFAPYRWYGNARVDSVGVTDSISANKDKTQVIVENALAGKTGVYYFEYLKDLQDPGGFVQQTLSKMGFTETNRTAFNGVGFIIHYQKQSSYAYAN